MKYIITVQVPEFTRIYMHQLLGMAALSEMQQKISSINVCLQHSLRNCGAQSTLPPLIL